MNTLLIILSFVHMSVCVCVCVCVRVWESVIIFFNHFSLEKADILFLTRIDF